MKDNHQLGEQLMKDMRLYLEEQEGSNLQALLGSIKVHLRSVVAVDIKCHPKLLYIYGQFNKLKELLEPHLKRKEQLLFPFLVELANGDDHGQIAGSKVVDSFLSIFRSENDSVAAIMRSIDDASGQYKVDASFPPSLKQAFVELKDLSGKVNSEVTKENAIFQEIHLNYKRAVVANKKKT